MKKTTIGKWAMVLVLNGIMGVSGFHSAYSQDWVIKNTNLVDVENGGIQENVDVEIRDGIIFDISTHRKKKKYAGVPVIDGQRRYLIPGFIDTHVHMAMGEVEVSVAKGQPVLGLKLQDDLPKISGELLLNHGITTARDPGGLTEAVVDIREKAASGEIRAPELLTAGSIIDTSKFVNLAATVKSEAGLREEIRKQKQAGVNFIKFYTSLSPELLRYGVDEARKMGLGTIGHLHGTSWTEASRLGIENIVHITPASGGYLPAEDQEIYRQYELMGPKATYKWFELVDLESEVIAELLRTLKENNTSIDPTLVVFHATFFGDTEVYSANPLLATYPQIMVDNWRTFFNFNFGWTNEDFQSAHQAWSKVQQFVKMLHDHGILLTVGTDSNNPWVIPGDSYHQEMKLLADSGIGNSGVLKMATINGARLLKIDNRTGSIEKGKEADLVLLNSNPLEDITNTRDISMVFSNGVKMDRQSR